MINREMLRFRESFRGYNRDDVNAYIEQISFVYSKKEAEYRAKIADLESKLNNEASVQVNAHSEDEWNKLTSELEGLKQEAAGFRAQLAETSTDNVDEDKSKFYDSMSSQVGNIILSANSNAEKIISDAKCEAERIKRDAEEYSAKLRADAEAHSKELVDKTGSRVAEFAADCTLKYNEIVNDATVALIEISSSIKSKNEKIKCSLDQKIKDLELTHAVSYTDNTIENL